MAGRVSHAIVLIKARHPYLHELATLATYFAYQTISLGFVILYRHIDSTIYDTQGVVQSAHTCVLFKLVLVHTKVFSLRP